MSRDTGVATQMSNPLKPQWTQQQAIDLCVKIEKISPKYGCHVALTGGLLYKIGPRKDCDILLYRIRQVASIDWDGLFAALAEQLGVVKVSGFGWVYKAEYQGKAIDFFNPDDMVGEHCSGDTGQPVPERGADTHEKEIQF